MLKIQKIILFSAVGLISLGFLFGLGNGAEARSGTYHNCYWRFKSHMVLVQYHTPSGWTGDVIAWGNPPSSGGDGCWNQCANYGCDTYRNCRDYGYDVLENSCTGDMYCNNVAPPYTPQSYWTCDYIDYWSATCPRTPHWTSNNASSCTDAPMPSCNENGVCGTATNIIHITSPTANLCSVGTPTVVNLNATSWDWTCLGSGTGVDSPLCSARKLVTSIAASPTSIPNGSSTDITWSATNAVKCQTWGMHADKTYVSGWAVQDRTTNANGTTSQTAPASPNQNATFSLRCWYGAGASEYVDATPAVVTVTSCPLTYSWIPGFNPSCSGKCNQTLSVPPQCKNDCTGQIVGTSNCNVGIKPEDGSYPCPACPAENTYKEVNP